MFRSAEYHIREKGILMSDTDQPVFDRLCAFLRETAILESTLSMLGWDERTGMPPEAAEYRGEQMTYLAGLIHSRRTDPQLGEWLDELTDSTFDADPHSITNTVIRESKRQFDRQKKLPSALVKEITRTAVQGQHDWQRAREQNDFSIFLPNLEQMVRLKCQEAEAVGFTECRYDALLDEYEPWATTAETAVILGKLREDLVSLLGEITSRSPLNVDNCLQKSFDIEKQKQFGNEVAAAIGFDFQRGRLDTTIHPFCTEIGPDDTRITTRYEEHFLPTALFGILHEAGHGIYEQGLQKEWYGLPPGQTISLGIHESQSRIWENQIGRSRAFWTYFYPRAQQLFAPSLAEVSLNDFYAAVNTATPSLIRVEADEVTYNLHILIRFELEQLLVDEQLRVADLPDAWNEKYESCLGMRPQNPVEGVLQDIHWSGGAIGYFPTYALGNLYSAQFFAQCKKDISDLDTQIANGEFAAFRRWLQENIHQRGQQYAAGELVERVTGEPLAHHFLVNYLREKMSEIYNL